MPSLQKNAYRVQYFEIVQLTLFACFTDKQSAVGEIDENYENQKDEEQFGKKQKSFVEHLYIKWVIMTACTL